jgi:hypothetical protein
MNITKATLYKNIYTHEQLSELRCINKLGITERERKWCDHDSFI